MCWHPRHLSPLLKAELMDGGIFPTEPGHSSRLFINSGLQEALHFISVGTEGEIYFLSECREIVGKGDESDWAILREILVPPWIEPEEGSAH